MKRITLCLLLCGILFGSSNALIAQNAPYAEIKGAEVAQARFLGKTRPLAEIAQEGNLLYNSRAKAKIDFNTEMPNFSGYQIMPTPFADVAEPKLGDPARQAGFDRLLTEIEPQLLIEGMDASDSNVFPPDPNGDVGLDYYIQMINSQGGAMMAIWDKETGDLVQAPMNLSALWAEFNAVGFGDGIVLFDQGANRWMLAEFGPLGTAVIYMAISETSDPFGAYYAYEFQTPNFPDYPKFGVWPNAYVFTTNEGGEPFMPVYAVDRQAMLNGEAVASAQLLTGIPKFSPGIFAFETSSVVDWDGNNEPPSDSPQIVLRMYDDAWGGGSDALEIWEIDLDWDDPSNTSINGPLVLPTAPFDSELCDGSLWDCLDQFGNQSFLSAIMQVIMHRPQYRNFGSYESIVLNFSVDLDGNNKAGIRWYELRRSGGGDWGIYQESTYAPDDENRFMASIAQDGQGNILMGFSTASPDHPNSLRYTGRRAGDPLNEMTIDEFEFAPGESAYSTFRWGDYSSMNVDPENDSDFWFTGEYMKATEWGTKIMTTFIRRDSNDIGPQALITPENSAFLTDMETVNVDIRNYGWLPAEDFTISYQVDNGPVVTETINGVVIDPDGVYNHTFATTADLSVIGPYDFTIITSMDIDTTVLNDTLRLEVRKLTRFDAGIADVLGLETPLCNSDFSAEIVLKNYGQDTLTSVDIIFSYNSGPETTINWTGSLAPGESEVVAISSTEPMLADNSLTVFTQNPNGMVDEDMGNDQLDRNFEFIPDGLSIRLELLTDNYPNETSWELLNDVGDILFSGDNYGQAETLFTENWCLAEGCYTFIIYDSWGDGIQFNGVEGNYQIINNDTEEVLAELIIADFGFSETNDFCTEVECLLTGNYSVINESSSGASDGQILIEALNGTPPFEYSIDAGNIFGGNPLFTGLPGGLYDIVIVDALGCTAEATVEIQTCLLQVSATTTNASNSNSEDGSITATPVNGTAPYSYSLDNIDFQDLPTFENLMAGDYTVYVVDAIGCTSEITVSVGSTVSTGEQFFGYELLIYPNPTPNLLTIELKGLDNESVLWYDVFDASGRYVKAGRLANFSGVLKGQISLKALASGNYYLRFQHENFTKMVKVQKVD